ncbi:MAG TPA: arginine--tRNA ligase, partial [Gammaproteobacteria bacterium]|nr:arginine--tRNA ligase [Gammaproteobacteria bacterium]
EQQAAFGHSKVGAGKSVQVEFVSANPTGPLHVGHGRGAAYGAVVSNLLDTLGYEVHREYYVNDAGRQMHILAASVWLRYLDLAGETIVFPSNGYQGDYVWDIAATLHREQGDKFRHPAETIFADMVADEPAGGDKELHIDALIERAQNLLGDDLYREVFDEGLNTIVENIRKDLTQFGVKFDQWFSERRLMDSNALNDCIERLRAADRLYEKDGALWFRSTDFGDEKDRVVRRENGQTTYFASDIAYHLNKLERVDEAIDIWGADHHGYVPRVKAAITAMGEDPERLGVLLIQFAVLYKGGEKLAMSTRSGQFVTLRELREEVGSDAARFFYVMRRHDQHLDFDLDLATTKSNENPVYYIQYAHARICSVLRQAKEKGIANNAANLSRLIEPQENDLITQLAKYPEQVEKAGLNREPHRIAQYLRELATLFHTYYNAHHFLIDDTELRDARLNLCRATQIVTQNGLKLLDVSAPEKM